MSKDSWGGAEAGTQWGSRKLEWVPPGLAATCACSGSGRDQTLQFIDTEPTRVLY